MITSFRTMLFPPREAMTTAEPPEPLTLQHSEFIIFKQVLQQIVGPAARLLFIPCVLWTEISCLFVPFVVSIQMFWLQLERSSEIYSRFHRPQDDKSLSI